MSLLEVRGFGKRKIKAELKKRFPKNIFLFYESNVHPIDVVTGDSILGIRYFEPNLFYPRIKRNVKMPVIYGFVAQQR